MSHSDEHKSGKADPQLSAKTAAEAAAQAAASLRDSAEAKPEVASSSDSTASSGEAKPANRYQRRQQRQNSQRKIVAVKNPPVHGRGWQPSSKPLLLRKRPQLRKTR